MNFVLTAVVAFVVFALSVLLLDPYLPYPVHGAVVAIIGMASLVLAGLYVFALDCADWFVSRRRWEERGRQMVIAETIKHHQALREVQQAVLRG